MAEYLAARVKSTVAVGTDIGTVYVAYRLDSTGLLESTGIVLERDYDVFGSIPNAIQQWVTSSDVRVRQGAVFGLTGWWKRYADQTGPSYAPGIGSNLYLALNIQYGQSASPGTMQRCLIVVHVDYMEYGTWDGSTPGSFTKKLWNNSSAYLLKSQIVSNTQIGVTVNAFRGALYTATTTPTPTPTPTPPEETPTETPTATGINKIIADFLDDVITKIKASITTALDDITVKIPAGFTTAINTLKSTVTALGTTLTDWAEDAKETLAATVGSAVETVGTTITTALQPFLQHVQQLTTSLSAGISNIATEVAGIVAASWNRVQAALTESWAAMMERVGAALDKIEDTLSRLLMPVRDALVETSQRMRDFLRPLIRDMTAGIDRISSTVAAALSTLVSTLRSLVTTLETSVTALWQNIDRTVESVALGFRLGLVGVMSELSPALQAAGERAVEDTAPEILMTLRLQGLLPGYE